MPGTGGVQKDSFEKTLPQEVRDMRVLMHFIVYHHTTKRFGIQRCQPLAFVRKVGWVH